MEIDGESRSDLESRVKLQEGETTGRWKGRGTDVGTMDSCHGSLTKIKDDGVMNEMFVTVLEIGIKSVNTF